MRKTPRATGEPEGVSPRIRARQQTRQNPGADALRLACRIIVHGHLAAQSRSPSGTSPMRSCLCMTAGAEPGNERAPRGVEMCRYQCGSLILALAGILLGEAALLLDLSNRLFGSYARTALGAATRIIFIVLLLFAL